LANIKDAYSAIKISEEGMVDMSDVPDWVAAAIASVKVITRKVTVKVHEKDPEDEDDEDRYEEHQVLVPEVKLHSKTFALDMMFKTLGTYKKDGSNPHVDDALAALVKAIGDNGLPKPVEIKPPPGQGVGESIH